MNALNLQEVKKLVFERDGIHPLHYREGDDTLVFEDHDEAGTRFITVSSTGLCDYFQTPWQFDDGDAAESDIIEDPAAVAEFIADNFGLLSSIKEQL